MEHSGIKNKQSEYIRFFHVEGYNNYAVKLKYFLAVCFLNTNSSVIFLMNQATPERMKPEQTKLKSTILMTLLVMQERP